MNIRAKEIQDKRKPFANILEKSKNEALTNAKEMKFVVSGMFDTYAGAITYLKDEKRNARFYNDDLSVALIDEVIKLFRKERNNLPLLKINK